jgi:hypothetical protein
MRIFGGCAAGTADPLCGITASVADFPSSSGTATGRLQDTFAWRYWENKLKSGEMIRIAYAPSRLKQRIPHMKFNSITAWINLSKNGGTSERSQIGLELSSFKFWNILAPCLQMNSTDGTQYGPPQREGGNFLSDVTLSMLCTRHLVRSTGFSYLDLLGE